MSRTYRRKKHLQEDKWWVLKEWRYKNGIITSYTYNEHSKEGKKLLAKYHSDAQVTMERVPAWYKKYFCRKPYRAKCRAAMYPAKFGEDIMLPIDKKSALLYW